MSRENRQRLTASAVFTLFVTIGFLVTHMIITLS